MTEIALGGMMDLRKALVAAHPKVRAVWSDIAPVARRDWIQWIGSAKRGFGLPACPAS